MCSRFVQFLREIDRKSDRKMLVKLTTEEEKMQKEKLAAIRSQQTNLNLLFAFLFIPLLDYFYLNDFQRVALVSNVTKSFFKFQKARPFYIIYCFTLLVKRLNFLVHSTKRSF
jgi:hypothetical protein